MLFSRFFSLAVKTPIAFERVLTIGFLRGVSIQLTYFTNWLKDAFLIGHPTMCMTRKQWIKPSRLVLYITTGFKQYFKLTFSITVLDGRVCTFGAIPLVPLCQAY